MFPTILRVSRRLHERPSKLTLLIIAGVAVACIQVTEAVLFGRVVNGLIGSDPVRGIFTVWIILGAIGIALSVSNALAADRLAHRNKLRTLSEATEAALSRSATEEPRIGATIRNILVGCDSFFQVWLNLLREFVPALTAFLVLLPIAFTMSAILTLTLFVLIVSYLAATLFIMNRTYTDQQTVDRRYQDLASRLSDVMTNVNLVHAFTRLHHETEAIRGMARAILARQYPVLNWWAVLNVFTQASSTISIVSILLVGSILVGQGSLSIGEVVTFSGFATLMIARMQQAAGAITRLYPAEPTMQALLAILDAGPEEAGDLSSELPPGPGRVTYENVSFTFPGSAIGVHGIDFEAHPGESIAIVGTTGAGKTTMLSLLQKIFVPTSGRILIDGHDIAGIEARAVRTGIAVVAQNGGLFDRSIADNLRVGKVDATDDELLASLYQAQLAELVQRTPEGLSFRIGERGGRLSGGERQRLSIARALLKDARILILDEATSALDTVTEAKIQRAIDEASRGRTTFIIAHRLSTIRNADRILVLERGRIVQQGHPAALEAEEGPFRRFLEAAENERDEQVEGELGKLRVARR